ncbi:MAG: bacterial Ig-like domain-containing protein, partial [Clostridia bacterium]|nr:bacterial Ig-like domain-containing protein [Clostridia bacterium]
MKRSIKRILGLILCLTMLASSLFGTVGLAASTGVYELTFENVFIFEQWANHPSLTVHGPGTTGSTITTDVASGSFTLVNNSDNEVFTSHSMSTVGSHYNMAVKPNTEYTFSYVANGTTTSFETFVFFFNAAGAYTTLLNSFATQYGQNEWTFTTPADAHYIQVRFDNNSPSSNVTVSNIIIRPSEVKDYASSISYRKTFTYTAGATYGALPVPTRADLVFAGWYTGPNGTGEKITSSTPVTATSKSLFAKWDPIVSGDIELVSLPIKTDYFVGEKVNTRGLVLGITYPDGTKENIDEGFDCSPATLTTAGTQTITVTYGGSSAQFTVNVKESAQRTIKINGTQQTVSCANNTYTLNYSGSAFNRYEITYSSDAYIKTEMTMGSVIEEFFLEPNENGTFSGYIDGFLSGTTQSAISKIKFTPLDKDSMSFSLDTVTLSKATSPAGSDGMVYLDGTNYKIGIDLDWGGALTYME